MPAIQNIAQTIATVPLPTFALVRNLVLKNVDEEPLPADGEVIATSHEPTVLLARVPMPQYPSASNKRDLFEEKFWEMTQDEFDAEVLAGEVRFNTFPLAVEDDLNDRKVFGASYSVLWLCPPHALQCAQVMVDAVPAFQKLSNASLEEAAALVWEEYADRAILASVDAEMQGGFYTQLTAHYEEVLNQRYAQQMNWAEFNTMIGR